MTDIIPLGFTGSSTQTFTLGGIGYDAQKSVVAGIRTIRMVRNGGGNFTTAQVETLLDALQYKNNATTSTVGIRSFSMNVLEGAYGSNIATHAVDVSCALPVSWLSFTGGLVEKNKVSLQWSTASEQYSKLFVIQHSINGNDWNSIGQLAAAGNSNQVSQYEFLHKAAVTGTNFYRIQQIDLDDRYSYSKTVNLKFSGKSNAIVLLQNSILNNALSIKADQYTGIVLMDPTGRIVLKKNVNVGVHNISLANLSKGVHYLVAEGVSPQVIIQ